MGGTGAFENEEKLWAYLAYGFLPEIDRSAPFRIMGDPSAGSAGDGDYRGREAAVSEGSQLLSSLAEEQASAHPSSTHVVLLSGGFDSRVILGSLLNVVDRTSIIACTYGYSGHEEFEIAARVARAAGVEHHRIRFEDTQWSTEELVQSVRARFSPPSFVVGARYQNHRIYQEYGKGCVYWEGLLAGAVTGGRLEQAEPPTDWRSALEAFARTNAYGRGKLTPSHYDPLTALPQQPLRPADEMDFDEQLDIALRQTCYIANRIPAGYTTATPFTSASSCRFWLGLPRALRYRQSAYREAVARAFPRLFSIPVAGGRGLATAPQWRTEMASFSRKAAGRVRRLFGGSHFPANPHLRTGHEMRTNHSLRGVMSENIADLEQRGLITWMSPAKLWSDHLSEKADHSDALRILVSLEIGLKAAS